MEWALRSACWKTAIGLFVQLLTALRDVRHPYGPRQDPLFRMHPERWLESLVRADVSVIDERLEPESVHS